MTSLMDKAANYVAYIAETRRRIIFVVFMHGIFFLLLKIMTVVIVYGPSIKESKVSTILAIPDSRFGYDSDHLFEVYMWMGSAGRRGFIILELFELITFIPLYPVSLSTLLLTVARKISHDEPLWIYTPFLAAIFDMLENSAHIYTALRFQAHRSIQKETWLHAAHVGSIANFMKWSCIGVSVMILLWMHGRSMHQHSDDDSITKKKSE